MLSHADIRPFLPSNCSFRKIFHVGSNVMSRFPWVPRFLTAIFVFPCKSSRDGLFRIVSLLFKYLETTLFPEMTMISHSRRIFVLFHWFKYTSFFALADLASLPMAPCQFIRTYGLGGSFWIVKARFLHISPPLVKTILLPLLLSWSSHSPDTACSSAFRSLSWPCFKAPDATTHRAISIFMPSNGYIGPL